MKFELYGQIFEKYSNQIFKKVHPVEAELFHADGRLNSYEEPNNRFP